MKAALIGIKGDFSRDRGYEVCRYMYELNDRLGKIPDIEIKEECPDGSESICIYETQ